MSPDLVIGRRLSSSGTTASLSCGHQGRVDRRNEQDLFVIPSSKNQSWKWIARPFGRQISSTKKGLSTSMIVTGRVAVHSEGHSRTPLTCVMLHACPGVRGQPHLCMGSVARVSPRGCYEGMLIGGDVADITCSSTDGTRTIENT